MNDPSSTQTGEPPSRVILVGRSELETALRSMSDVDLQRARSGVDALGELSSPFPDNESDGAMVLVGDGAIEDDEFDEFSSAARSLDASVNIVDARGLSIADVERLLADDERETPREPAREHPSQPAAADERRETPQDDAGALEAILTGRDPLETCLREIRSRLGDPTVAFITSNENAPVGETHAEVQRGGAVFGLLCSERSAVEPLRIEAERLARWLALAEQQRQLRDAAFTDKLTCAWNRRYFDQFLPRAIENARSLRHDVTLMVYDIDDFKSYNDRYGHAAGDEILRETVRLLLSCVRPTDRVCRIGGDEFAVVFDDPDGPREGTAHHPMTISQIASRFQQQICEHRFPKLGTDAPGTLTISGGMATFPWDGACAESLLNQADQLALESKRAGKNVITFGPGAQRVCGAAQRSSRRGDSPENTA